MTGPLSFIHASDLHLDRPPRGLAEVPDSLRPALVDAPYRAAERVFDAAIKEHVDFVVLAGDILDPALAGPRGLLFLSEQFHRLVERNIGVYWALGRSDRFEPWTDAWTLPSGVVRFAVDRVERIVHQRTGQEVAQILGTSTAQRKKIGLADFRAEPSDLFAVAVAHGSADSEDLARHAVNYWALGGEHQAAHAPSGPAVAHYSGSPQGRRPREAGPHGCTLVHVDETRRVRTSFIPTDAVRFLSERVGVNESTTPEQLHQVLGDRIGELAGDPFGPDLLIQWTIVGSQALSADLRRGKLAADLATRLRGDYAGRRPAVWTISVDAEQSPAVSEDRYDEESLLGEFLRTARHYEEHSEEPLAIEACLSERHVAGNLAAMVALDEPDVRRRVLAEVARLGLELLGPQEPRP